MRCTIDYSSKRINGLPKVRQLVSGGGGAEILVQDSMLPATVFLSIG